ncbi:MAG: hypothetical protein OFPII_04210 [Osedax symbiont Rs1]|nr:MAG: hypothetical protein OFPII_04210 [Osedax symbiont Rs1]
MSYTFNEMELLRIEALVTKIKNHEKDPKKSEDCEIQVLF